MQPRPVRAEPVEACPELDEEPFDWLRANGRARRLQRLQEP